MRTYPSGHLERAPKSVSQDFVDVLPATLRIVLLLPALAIALVLTLYPLLLTMLSSLQSASGGWSIQRYVSFFADPRSFAAVQRTLSLAAAATAGSLVLSVAIAYVFRRLERGRAAVRVLVTAPLAIPVLIAAYALTITLSERSLLNNFLVVVLHVLPQPVGLSYTWTGLILACVWRYFPFSALLAIAALEGLNPALEEAAYIAGACPYQVMARIVLPLLVPALVTGGLITFVGVFGTFSMPLIMGGGGQDVLAVVAYREIEGRFDFASASVIVVVMTVLQLSFFGAVRRVFGRRRH